MDQGRIFFLSIILLLGFFSHAQKNSFDLEISTSKDTIKVGEGVLINIKIRNSSKNEIKIFKNFTFVSNIYPNPEEQVSRGMTLVFDVKPNPIGGDIWVEDQVVIEEVEMQILEPGVFVEIQYDFNRHLNDFISLTDPLEEVFRISLTYDPNRQTRKNRVFKKEVKSNVLEIYLQKE